jgi:hypothetical protein
MLNETPVGLTKTQRWEVGVSRTLPLTPAAAWDGLIRVLGLPEVFLLENRTVPPPVMFETDDGTRAELRSHQPGSLLRMRWLPPGWAEASTLELRVNGAKSGARVSVHHELLPDAAARETLRAHWAAILGGLHG